MFSEDMGGLPKIWENPQIIHFNRVFHYFHHPFWGTIIFGNTHMCFFLTTLQLAAKRGVENLGCGFPFLVGEKEYLPPGGWFRLW